MSVITVEDALLYRDVHNLMLGECLGNGIARSVYVFTQQADRVVKLESTENYQNVTEWHVWNRVKDTDHAKWFAPCYALSANGRALVMARTRPTSPEKYPDKLPAFLTDTKYQNYGLFNGRIVCHDYGSNLLMEVGMTKRMHKVKWWDPRPWNEKGGLVTRSG